MYLIGYDIGSSSIKAALIDAKDHSTIAVIQYPDNEMDMLSRQSGWAEQQPEVWWQNFCFATRKLLTTTKINPTKIKGIGIGYQMHGLVLIDEEKHVLRPSIIWCDSRAVSIGDKAFLDIGEQYCLKNLLNSPGNFTASKLKWVKDNEPEIYSKIHKIMLPGDFIAMRLTGEISTTISGLSEAILWDYAKGSLASKVMDYYGIEKELIPPIVPTFSVQGKLTQQAAELTGLAKDTPVAYRAGDQPNNALSLNVLNPGEIAATSGTSGVVYGIVDEPIFDERSRVNAFAHVNYEQNFDRVGVLLCINGAGIQYSWMKHQMGRSQAYADMERMATTVPIGADGLCILPFGNGSERILENKNLKSHVFNLQFNRHTRSHLYRAALEGVAFSFVFGVNILKEMGLNVEVMRVGQDNMFQSDVFSKTIATLLGCHIEMVDTTGAIGAARAAGVAANCFENLEEALYGIKPSKIYEPQLNLTACAQAYNYWQSSLERTLTDEVNDQLLTRNYKKQYYSLSKELDRKSKELAKFSMQMNFKNDFINSLKKDIDKTKTLSFDQQKKELSKLSDKIANYLGNTNDWDVLEEHFDILNDNFFQKLKNQFGELSTQDAKLCALIKLKMSNKEIADQLNLSVRGVETKRYRLRKKLKLDTGVSLDQFIVSIA